MPSWFACPYLGAQVELTDERYEHIAAEHRDFLPFLDRIEEALREPDSVRGSKRDPAALLFTRWYDDIEAGKHVIVVVVTHQHPEVRHWIATAYMASRLSGGTVEWVRS